MVYVLGICGSSGSGKTRLAERLVLSLSGAGAGYKVSVIKHAHHDVDVDTPGKDSWVLRKAGAYETMLVSSRRWMLIRELEQELPNPDVHDILEEIKPCDWIILEGFKHANLHKIEVWRFCVGKPPIYLNDDCVKAIITDDPKNLPVATHLPVFSAEDVQGLLDWLVSNAELFAYKGR